MDFCDPDVTSVNSMFSLPLDSTRITQQPNGSFSHTGQEAWDMLADVGTPLNAARGGTVVFVRESETETCTTDPEDCPGNGIVIEHQDGTEAAYWHIPVNGSDVSVDDEVARGERIGRTGNTGFSTDPHLHFQSENRVPALFSVRHRTTGPDEFRSCYSPVTGDLLFRE